MNIETANRLYQFRKKHNLSQEELAGKIGVSRQAVSKWERAEASPDTDNLILLAEIYGVTLDELLKEKAEDKEKITTDEKGNNNEDIRSEKVREENSSAQDTAQSYNGNNCDDCQNDKCENNENTNWYKKDNVRFKNGSIHVDSKDGDRVDIGFGGIHVNDKNGTKVSIDSNGVFVEDGNGNKKAYTDENGHIFYDKDLKEEKKKSLWYIIPYPIIVVILFLIWGCLGGWAISWLLFLTIPVYYTLIDAIKKKNPNHFAYPVVTALVYLWLGMTMGIWHPTWIIFLTIPVYYCICDFFKQILKQNK